MTNYRLTYTYIYGLTYSNDMQKCKICNNKSLKIIRSGVEENQSGQFAMKTVFKCNICRTVTSTFKKLNVDMEQN